MYFKAHFIGLGILSVLLVCFYFYIDIVYRSKIMKRLEQAIPSGKKYPVRD